MINWEIAWKRANEGAAPHPLVRGKKKQDFRALTYVQTFSNIALAATTANQLQTFPSGAFVLGICAAAVLPKITKADQYYADGAAAPLDTTIDRGFATTPGNLDLFGLSFQYTNDEIITPGGPISAAALLGPTGTLFPARELIIDPSQGILASAQNLISFQLISGAASATGITFPITVHVGYTCMVPRSIG